MLIIDNFLEQDVFEKMKNEICGNTFPWKYASTKSASKTGEESEDLHNHQMYNTLHGFDHMIHRMHSPQLKLVWPIFFILKPMAILRVKVNRQFPTNEIYESDMHTDNNAPENVPIMTGVLYMNTNNGYTKFENGEKIYSYENRAVLFDGHTKHCGSTCTDSKERVVINFNYISSLETPELENKILYN